MVSASGNKDKVQEWLVYIAEQLACHSDTMQMSINFIDGFCFLHQENHLKYPQQHAGN
jgi:hypothetical protein